MVTEAVSNPAGCTPGSFTVKVVAVAVVGVTVTVEPSPNVKVTTLFPAVVEKPKPLIVRVVAVVQVPGKLVVCGVIAGITVATCTAVPLLTLDDLTVVVSVPAVRFVTATSSWFADTTVTVPAVPPVKVTVVPVVKPKPLMVKIWAVVPLATRLTLPEDTTGATVVTCTAAPLLTLSVPTEALRIVPTARPLRPLRPVTVNWVGVAAVTVPVTPPLKVARLFPGVVLSKPTPLMVMVVALTPTIAVVDEVTTGVTVATCTPVVLLWPLLVTVASRFPPINVPFRPTVNVVAVAAVTVAVPVKPLLKLTELFVPTGDVVEKPKPWMVTVVTLAAKLVVLRVIVGTTVATCTAMVPLLTVDDVTLAASGPATRFVTDTVSWFADTTVTVPAVPPVKVTVVPVVKP